MSDNEFEHDEHSHEEGEGQDPTLNGEGGGRRRSGEGGSSRKRTRTMMTPAQLSGLKGLWNETCEGEPFTKFPTTAQREDLAKKIGLTPRKVQVWFQNQRQKNRRVELQDASTPFASTSSSSSSSALFPPPASFFHQPPLPLASSYAYQPTGDVSGAPFSSDQVAQQQQQPSFDPFSLPPLAVSADTIPFYPSYSSYRPNPPPRLPPPPTLLHYASYYPQNDNESSFPASQPPTAQDLDGHSHLFPPLTIQPRSSYEEERAEEERRAAERRRRRNEEDRAQEMSDERWNARGGWEMGRGYESDGREGGPSGGHDVPEEGPSRIVFGRDSEEGGGGGSCGWSSTPQDASFPGPTFASSSSSHHTFTPHQNAYYSSFHDSPFTPVARAASPFEHPHSSHRPRSPMLDSQRRSASPPSFSHIPHTNTGSQQHLSSPLLHNLATLEPKTFMLPSFGSFLSTTSTASNPSSLSSSTSLSPEIALRHSAYPSYISSSSNSSYPYPRRSTSSSSSRGIGGASDSAGRGRAHHDASSFTSSRPRSSAGSSNGGAALLSLSTFTFASSSSSPSSSSSSSSSNAKHGLVSSSLANESSSRSTLDGFNSPWPSLSVGSSVPGGAGHSSSSYSSFSSQHASLPPPSTSSSSSSSANFPPLPPSREGSISDQSTNYFTEITGIESRGRMIDQGMGAEVGEEGVGLGLGSRAALLPGMLDVVGFGGRSGLGRFSTSSGGSTRSSR